ncbi:hypothetical protein HCN44_008398 [Aphidius gifuensis]|uniref:Uncharacterized protein n=1 Tax=Aphidius gifuensis TaxID=684658 RepID=A0A834XR29_APHGI|nr:uncharacterized protein LOC122858126 [Aphidius gifuensis]XP_044016765.1 uncharacterized protein LOC122858126 [Aphidius gifuensis]KAF7989724.1 hypothetical protein HCN44_008398 [Aphidius gifuensis]
MLCPDKIKTTPCRFGTTDEIKNYQKDYLRLHSEIFGATNQTIKKWQNSTSSGYASHSSPPPPPPPLSASISGGLYSTCYASASSATKLIDPGLSIIHETDIPRPIWPYKNYNKNKNNWIINLNDNVDYLYTQYNTKLYSHCYDNSSIICHNCFIRNSINTKAKDILIELSNKLNSIIYDDDNDDITAEDILEDISKIIAKGINATVDDSDDLKINNQQEEQGVDNIDNSSTVLNKKMTNLIGSDIVNPVNHMLYEKSGQFSNSRKFNLKNNITSGLSMPRCCGISSVNFIDDIYHEKNKLNIENFKLNCELTKSKGTNNKICYTNDEPVYTTLVPSDESSSYGVIGPPLSSIKQDWNDSSMVFNKDMDFTLDGVRAERLECAIARAKNKRKWCRIIITIFGLVFFILSVIIVTMSVTRGRKIFGSM